MNIEQLKNALPDYAKDIKLNLSNVITEEGAPDLTNNQIYIIALASACATKNKIVIDATLESANNYLSADEIQAAKAAAIIMAMNNVYYRSIHLISDKSFITMPAKLRMNVIGNPGINKIDFELCCLAVSAINGCGMCIDSHMNTLLSAGVSKLSFQSTLRISAVFNAVAQAMEIG